MSLDAFVVRHKRKQTGESKCTTQAKQQCVCPGTETLNEIESSSSTPAVGDSLKWRKITAENLDLDYVKLFQNKEADCLLQELEESIEYNSGQLAKVLMFGKWVDVPRKQTAYGDNGLSYTFSGNTIPARPWIPCLQRIRDVVTACTGFRFNFVLVNRYKDGCDYMGEHKDDEKDLMEGQPIASVSLGQARHFYFKHGDSRGAKASRRMDAVTLTLDHGSLLMMNPPTNRYWYHALPRRKRLVNPRINLTFRSMNLAKCKPVKAQASQA